MKRKLIVGFLFILLVGFLAANSGCENSAGKSIKTLVINRACYTSYPAVIVSLDNAAIISLPEDRKLLRGASITGDLWIEPRDPEIQGLKARFEGAVHVGEDVKVALVKGSFDEIHSVPEGVTWERYVNRRLIKPGLVFLTRSSTGKFYKVRVDGLVRKDNTYPTDPNNESSMKLSFQAIKG